MQLFANNETSLVASPMSAVALSMQVTAGEGAKFPSPTGSDFFLLTLATVTSGNESNIEIVKVTSRSTDVLTIQRGQEGTTAVTHPAGDLVSMRVTAGTMADLKVNSVTAGTITGPLTGNASTATALATARNIDGQAFDGTGNVTVIAPGTHAATGKSAPVDADELPLVDSAASNVLKKLTWADLKAAIAAFKDVSGGYAGLTLLKLNLRNAGNTFTNFLTNATTAVRTWTMPDKDGTVAMTSDITGTNSGTNTGDQTITLTGGVTGSGTGSFAATVVTNANLTGEVTSAGNATTVTNAAVIGKVLTGYVSGAGAVGATDTVLGAIQKLNGNDALRESSANKDATGGYAGLTLYKINFKNAANTFTSFLTNANTAARTYTFPDKDMTVAALDTNTFTGAQILSDQQVSRAMLIDTGHVFLDKGNSGTTTQTLDFTAGGHQKVTATGNHTFAFSNWPPSGNTGYLMMEAVNYGAYTITPPTINWIKPDGTITTSMATYFTAVAAAGGRAGFQASGTDFLVLWTRDAGTTVFGKVL